MKNAVVGLFFKKTRISTNNVAKLNRQNRLRTPTSHFLDPRGPLLGSEIVPKPHKVAPKDPPAGRDSGEPGPGVPQ